MVFNWKEYLDLALFLQGNEIRFTLEAAHRSAVSRVYYSAFCHARNYAKEKHKFKPTNTGKDHILVRKHFKNRKMSDIAKNLDKLRQWRNSCDYFDEIFNLTSILKSSIEKAQIVINRLK